MDTLKLIALTFVGKNLWNLDVICREIALILLNEKLISVDNLGNLRCNYILTSEEISIGMNDGKVKCIVEYKRRLDCSLVEAKHTVEKFFKDNNLKFYTYQNV